MATPNCIDVATGFTDQGFSPKNQDGELLRLKTVDRSEQAEESHYLGLGLHQPIYYAMLLVSGHSGLHLLDRQRRHYSDATLLSEGRPLPAGRCMPGPTTSHVTASILTGREAEGALV